MIRFKIGDRVFDIRYGWGIVREGFTASTITVWFEDVNVNTSYDVRFASNILSFTEYTLDGHSLERPELNYSHIFDEWYRIDDSMEISYLQYLDENFEPPVRKCK
jgi:hypothetical protein